MTHRFRSFALTLTFFFICVLLAPMARAQPEVIDLDPLAEKIVAQHKIPAIGLTVATSEGVIARGVAGTRGRGIDEPVSSDACWHLGSCTKAMTATLVARLVERGDLTWDTTIADAFMDTTIKIHPDYQSVTITQLLQHRGGLPGDLVGSPIWPELMSDEGDPAKQRWKIAQSVLVDPPTGKPGEQYAYSNAGYVVAGLMLETITGRTYEDLMREQVFEPLGMTSPGWGAPSGEHDPVGHRKGWPVPPGRFADNPPGLSPAGRAHMTLDDWARYATVHLKGERGEETGFLSPESFKRLHTPPEGAAYALGWGRFERDWAGGDVIAHSGSNTMWLAKVFIAPKRDLVILVATNDGGDAADPAVEDAIGRILRGLAARQRSGS